MPFGSFASMVVLEVEPEAGLGESPTIVEVEDERLKVLAKGARWVSFSSSHTSAENPTAFCRIDRLFVSFHDMLVCYGLVYAGKL